MLVRATNSATRTQLAELAAEGARRAFLLSQQAPDPEAVLRSPGCLAVWSNGAAAVAVNGVWRTLSPDRFVVAGAGRRLRLRADPASRGRVFVANLPASVIDGCLEDLGAVSPRFRILAGREDPVAGISGRLLWQDSAVGPVLTALNQAATLGMRDHQWMDRQVRLLAERLLYLALRSGGASPGRRPSRRDLLRERLERVRELIETRYPEPINLDSMAETACVSRYHFLREFRRAYGETPYRLLVNRRLQAARELLEDERLSVQEISRRVGFASPDGFYRAFRRRFRASPSAFRGHA